MSEHICGGECADGSACQNPVSTATERCHLHDGDDRGDASVDEAETHADAEGRASAGQAMRAAAERHAKKVNSGDVDPGASSSDDGSNKQPRTDGGAPEINPSLEPEEFASVSLTSCGDALRSFFKLPAVLVQECILRFDGDGLHIRAVDPANVGMIDVELPGEMFSRYDVEGEVEFGVNLKRLRKTLRWARKGRGNADGDPVRIDFLSSTRRIRVRVIREDSRMVRQSEWGTIEPDSVRDRPDIPDLKLPNRARPEVGALGDAIGAVDDASDNMRLTREQETLVLSSIGDGNNVSGDESERVTLLGTAWDTRPDEEAAPCESLFTLDYFGDAVAAIDGAGADRLTLKWGDEFPLQMAFSDERWSISGEFMLAPRIQSGGDA